MEGLGAQSPAPPALPSSWSPAAYCARAAEILSRGGLQVSKDVARGRVDVARGGGLHQVEEEGESPGAGREGGIAWGRGSKELGFSQLRPRPFRVSVFACKVFCSVQVAAPLLILLDCCFCERISDPLKILQVPPPSFSPTQHLGAAQLPACGLLVFSGRLGGGEAPFPRSSPVASGEDQLSKIGRGGRGGGLREI